MIFSNSLSDHNDRVAHSSDWDEPPDNYYLEDLIMAFFSGPRTLEARTELQNAIRKLKEEAIKYGEEEEISDDYLRDGLEDLLTGITRQLWPDNCLIERGDRQ